MCEKRKTRKDVKYIAKCGLVPLSRCRLRTANLEECKTCTHVKRWTDKWKMVNRKPVRQCSRCKEFKSLDDFYPKKVKHGDVIYECYECRCKECRKKEYMEYRDKKRKATE